MRPVREGHLMANGLAPAARRPARGPRRDQRRQPHRRQAVQVRRRARQGRGPGYDCSGTVSYALIGAKLLEDARWTRRQLHGLGRRRPGRVDHRLHEPRPRLRGHRRAAARHERGRRPERRARARAGVRRCARRAASGRVTPSASSRRGAISGQSRAAPGRTPDEASGAVRLHDGSRSSALCSPRRRSRRRRALRRPERDRGGHAAPRPTPAVCAARSTAAGGGERVALLTGDYAVTQAITRPSRSRSRASPGSPGRSSRAPATRPGRCIDVPRGRRVRHLDARRLERRRRRADLRGRRSGRTSSSGRAARAAGPSWSARP